MMDIVASTASVAQLLGQTISLVQQISEARETVRGYPKLLSDHHGHLTNIRDTLRLVEDEKQLQTASVTDQVRKLRDISRELHIFLQRVASWNGRNTARQYIHAIGSGKHDEKKLAGILDRLDRAKSELGTLILLAQVGITGTLHDGLAATQPVIQRIDTNVQRVLGAEAVLHSRPPRPKLTYEDDHPPVNEADLRAPGSDSPTTGRSERVYVGNLSFDQARMINGDVGSMTWKQAATGEYRKNEARGSSLQVNGRMDSQAYQELLAAHK